MKRFIRDIILFLLPLICLIACVLPFYYVSKKCGELENIQKSIIAQRNNHNIIIGLGYNEQTPIYKLTNANYYNAEVIALGTSRVMQFKADFFNCEFYNCGGAVGGNYNEYINFLENLTYKPNTVFVGLDAWVFNDAWNQTCDDYSNYVAIGATNRDNVSMLKSIVKDWLDGKWKFSDLNCYPENIGFNGRVKESGFMYDGSYYYGDVYRNPEEQSDYKFRDTFNRIDTGTRRFEWGEHIDNDTVNQLENLLKYCTEKDINIIGFLTPFAPSVYSKMEESDKYGYIDEIGPICDALFSKYNFEFYDYNDGSCLNVTDDYFVDGFHGSEVVYGYIIYEMINSGSSISQYVDSKVIEYLLDNAYGKKTLFAPDEKWK